MEPRYSGEHPPAGAKPLRYHGVSLDRQFGTNLLPHGRRSNFQAVFKADALCLFNLRHPAIMDDNFNHAETYGCDGFENDPEPHRPVGRFPGSTDCVWFQVHEFTICAYDPGADGLPPG